jgi:NADPH2:quinone reductase
VKAWLVEQYGSPTEALRFTDAAPQPEPEPGTVTVRVQAAALNLPDERLCRGTYQLRPNLPFTPGMEAAGQVESVGEGVDPQLVGRRVVGVAGPPYGSLAEVAVVRSTGLYPIPDDVRECDAAALLIPFTTGHLALHRRGKLRAGETLLVHAGAGGVGSAAIQLGVLAGARVIATAGGPEKLEICRRLGADVAIDYREGDLVAAVRELTEGRGVDVVHDSVGGDVFHASRRCLAREGRLLVIGFAGGELADAPTNHALYRNYDIVGVYFGGYSGADDAPWRLEIWERVLADFRVGRLRPLIDRTLALNGEIPAALDDLASRRTIGRVVVETP